MCLSVYVMNIPCNEYPVFYIHEPQNYYSISNCSAQLSINPILIVLVKFIQQNYFKLVNLNKFYIVNWILIFMMLNLAANTILRIV